MMDNPIGNPSMNLSSIIIMASACGNKNNIVNHQAHGAHGVFKIYKLIIT